MNPNTPEERGELRLARAFGKPIEMNSLKNPAVGSGWLVTMGHHKFNFDVLAYRLKQQPKPTMHKYIEFSNAALAIAAAQHYQKEYPGAIVDNNISGTNDSFTDPHNRNVLLFGSRGVTWWSSGGNLAQVVVSTWAEFLSTLKEPRDIGALASQHGISENIQRVVAAKAKAHREEGTEDFKATPGTIRSLADNVLLSTEYHRSGDVTVGCQRILWSEIDALAKKKGWWK